ncbi:MAG TPA: metallophosphoesterase family protein [Kofleriaceae bacterium]|nr:metallophosphoesterase family protein [Kofleriaceae bacterium]
MPARVLIVVLLLASRARAESVAPPPVTSGVQLVRADAQWRYQIFTAPQLAPQIGALAISGLDVALGRAQSPIAVLGDEADAPVAWPYDVDAATVANGPLAPTASDARIAALFAVTPFTLTHEHQGLRVLEIRLRYHDGCAVWLNGSEVARRSLDGGTVALAARPHGPEWETFYVSVAPGLLRLGENVLAIEVHPSGRSNAPDLAADVVGRRELGLVRGPIITDIGATSATISIETDANLDAALEWGTGQTLDHRLTSAPGRMHRFKLDGLPPRTAISYRVHAGASQSPQFAFHTTPPAGELIRIGIYGDVRGGHDTHRKLVEQMLGEGLDLVAVTGDMVMRGTDNGDWQKFFAVTRELLATVRYLPAIGNHDLGWRRADPDVFAFPTAPAGRPDATYWYSLDVADIHLVFLDSNAYERTEQEQWLDADLAAARARGARAIIALTHDGPYSRGVHRGSQIARERYVPILAKYHVDLLVGGHDHLYQRGEAGGIHYIVSGGGGAGLYQPTCGVGRKPKCAVDGMQKVASEHHYLVLAIDKETIEMCPRRPDGKLLEKCTRYGLWRP